MQSQKATGYFHYKTKQTKKNNNNKKTVLLTFIYTAFVTIRFSSGALQRLYFYQAWEESSCRNEYRFHCVPGSVAPSWPVSGPNASGSGSVSNAGDHEEAEDHTRQKRLPAGGPADVHRSPAGLPGQDEE